VSTSSRAVVLSIVIMGFAALLYSGAAKPTADRKPVTHTVSIDASSFSPATLAVRSGDSVVWMNKDIIPHTASSERGRFDSGTLETGKSWTYTAKTKGEFPYVCAFHPTMKGTLRVE
jgi:plastocyanin